MSAGANAFLFAGASAFLPSDTGESPFVCDDAFPSAVAGVSESVDPGASLTFGTSLFTSVDISRSAYTSLSASTYIFLSTDGTFVPLTPSYVL